MRALTLAEVQRFKFSKDKTRLKQEIIILLNQMEKENDFELAKAYRLKLIEGIHLLKNLKKL